MIDRLVLEFSEIYFYSYSRQTLHVTIMTSKMQDLILF